jgi:dolichol-phosphate mannosyltransferase
VLNGYRERLVRTVVVAPTYQEAENIGDFLRRLRAASPDAEVIIVDDSSPDGTADIARVVGGEVGGVEVVVRTDERGLGSAYRHGFRLALDRGAEVVVSMDVDLSHDPSIVPAFVAAIAQGADLVVGSRYVPGGGTVDWPIHRRLLSRWGNRYTGLVLGLRVRDATSGFRAYRRSALESAEPEATSAEGYAFLTELLRRAVRSGARVVEHPIRFVDRERGTSKMSGRIIVESMLLVTRWGLRDLVDGRRRSQRRQ